MYKHFHHELVTLSLGWRRQSPSAVRAGRSRLLLLVDALAVNTDGAGTVTGLFRWKPWFRE